MYVFFTTVIRGASIERGGELVRLNWDTKEVEQALPIMPTNPVLVDPNPRGNTRGGRGIVQVGDDLVVANYHTLKIFSADFHSKRDITHNQFAGLHELCATPRGTVFVAATAIDAALEVDLATGQVVREYWPREDAAFIKHWELQPLSIDKSLDNRGRYLAREHMVHRSHLHLNAVATWNDEVYALANSFGSIINLDTSEVVIEDRSMRGAHNLRIEEDGTAFVNDTLNRQVRMFNLRTRQAGPTFPLTSYPPIKRLERQSWFADALAHWLKRVGLKSPMARPLFVRGLARVDNHLFVGMSPASIARIDLDRMEIVDLYQYSKDVGACIHGLHIVR